MHSSRHVSFDQMKAMIEFMAQHNEFASGALRTVEARHTSKKLWNELTNILNSTKNGPKKSAHGWSKYWSDFKNKLKNKVSVISKSKGSKTNSNLLSKLERKVLAILGPQFIVKKHPNNYVKRLSNHRPPEIKLETHNGSTEKNCSNSSSENSEASDTDKADIDDSLHGLSDTEENTNGLHNIYPKWLIEVEKKRAEADLIRAKAEEQRVNIAAKNAEAAVIQAEALRKLADAAATQADAILRIAMAIERNQMDVLAV